MASKHKLPATIHRGKPVQIIPKNRHSTINLDEETFHLIEALSDRHGFPRTNISATIRLAVRDAYELHIGPLADTDKYGTTDAVSS